MHIMLAFIIVAAVITAWWDAKKNYDI